MIALVDKCVLCRKADTTDNPTNKHHIKGKKYPDVMRVHSHTCHWFAQWVTNLYLLHGREDELSEKFLIYLYQRVVTLTNDGDFVLPVYK